ncbi:acyl carrier protein [Helicobacter sp. MIT 11-5569]|uniref:acyl carrier protein n=1 Tax=Helicobacter sp. MIT 11-5569 TaxID=1548151 RepID=UPI00051FA5EA|nr:acyl carrier protein [Helicobacter sp. MIT 11-5569]TLD81172.1 acyl carrier protein [Helicobacter sp. MIT 11-5569]
MKQKVCEILGDILEVEVNENTQVSRQNCEKWTSLAHIDIVMSIEEEFNIMFSEQDLPKIDSQDLLVNKIWELIR